MGVRAACRAVIRRDVREHRHTHRECVDPVAQYLPPLPMWGVPNQFVASLHPSCKIGCGFQVISLWCWPLSSLLGVRGVGA